MLALKIIEDVKDEQIINNREEIRMDQMPEQPSWGLIPLYKDSLSGNMVMWQICFDGKDNLEIRIDYEDGIIHMEKIGIPCDVKDKRGYALRECRKHYKLKSREGYYAAGVGTPLLIKGMKGYEYKTNSIKVWPVYVQPKLNGIRMLCQNMGHSRLGMRSWLNNSYTHLTHIENELREFFEYLPRYATLDGECYNHNMDFQTLISAVKTIKTVHPLLHKVQYWIFDINYDDAEGTPFEKRYALLVNAFHRYIEDRKYEGKSEIPETFTIVQSQIARNHNEVMMQCDKYITEGYEGIMVKKISNGYTPDTKTYKESLYRQDKCNHILKYKNFRDEEVMVINVSESDGRILLTVRDARNNSFLIGMKGDPENQKLWLQDKSMVVGKEATIRFKEFSEKGIPKNAVGVAIRDYE